MNNLQRIRSFLNWQKQEHLNDTSTADMYDTLSTDSNYDSIVDFETRSKSFETLLNNIDLTNKTALDLACGSGAFIKAILNKNPKRVTGVDLSSGMLKLAQNRFVNNSKVELINKSFIDVTFPDNMFDLIVLANAVRYIPVGLENTFFSNIEKWLKSDGIFITHSDFWGGLLGRITAPIILNFTNNKHVNPKTTFDWTLEKELIKHFVIFDRKQLKGSMGDMHHLTFFCKKRLSL